MQAHELPVYKQRNRILTALESSQVIVVESPTGSGKTTQLPLILHEAGYGKKGVIGVTQPRRIAAISVTEYIRKQLPDEAPDLAAYKMRFDDTTTPTTRMKIMTDGILLQELKADHMLSHYSVIMVDEAHERSLNIDFILGLLKRVLAARPEFRVIVSSATINAEVFSEYFDSCPVVRIDTEMYPVTVIYDPPLLENTYDAMIYKVAEIADRIVREKREGDILIFLSGERMIKDCIMQLYGMPFRKKLHILPLYGRLSKEEQERVFPPAPEGKTKVVVATNIAETSVTIDGIAAVIDSGLAKMNYYNPRTYTSSLVEGPISRASANQRKGRAGRTRPGVCYRLYGKDDYDTRPLFSTEEIYRTDLSEVVLRMAELGITDFDTFDFISSPGRRGIQGAVETLFLLSALNPDNSLSEIGKSMAAFPLLPRHSRIIVEAIRRYPEVIRETVVAASFLTTNSPFLLPQGEEVAARKAHHKYRDDLGDFVSYLKLLQAYSDSDEKEKFCERRYLDTRTMAEIRNVSEQLSQIVSDMGIPIGTGGSRADYLCAVSTGLVQFVCARTGRGVYRTLTADRIQIHPGSVMFREDPEYIVAGEIVRTSRMYARSVSPLERSWIPRISTELADKLLGTAARKGGKRGKRETAPGRDTTWQTRIGHVTFTLQPLKGKKKIAVLPWQDLVEALSRTDVTLHPQQNNLRGKIVYGNYEIMSGARLSDIARVARFIDPSRDITKSWPRRQTYNSMTGGEALCEELDNILKLAPARKSARQLGFLGLHSSTSGEYWFKPDRNFYAAVDESLSSLEALADELPEDTDRTCVERVNLVYRRLASIYET